VKTILLNAFFVIAASAELCSAGTLIVADSNCTAPKNSGGFWNSNCPPSFPCVSTFPEEFTLTDPGVPVTVQGATHTCGNCNGCPTNPPPPNNCSTFLSASFTETTSIDRSYAVSSGPLSAPWLQAKAEIKFGNQNGVTRTHGVNCGPSNFPPCKKTMTPYSVTMQCTTNMKATMTVSFSWNASIPVNTSDSACPQSVPNMFEIGGSNQSVVTATGSKSGSNAHCDNGIVVDCDNE
jgi:hypothetical protein